MLNNKRNLVRYLAWTNSVSYRQTDRQTQHSGKTKLPAGQNVLSDAESKGCMINLCSAQSTSTPGFTLHTARTPSKRPSRMCEDIITNYLQKPGLKDVD